MRDATVDDIADFIGGPQARRKMLIADLFCGAGGSSTGIDLAMAELGLDYELVCVNHWQTAIDTHAKNHPRARHYCQDIATVRPHQVCPEGYLDLLTGSPTCTHHSVARGGKPTSDQQRSDPWHIIPWLTELRVDRMILENVWEWVKWGPVDPVTMRPIKSREGEYYRAYIDTIWKCGATSIEWRKLNSANYGAATTRNRYFGFFRFDNKRLIWPVVTHAKNPAPGSGLQRWRPAREIVDWSIKGKSIFKRKTPLAPKTLARILAGAQKFGWPDIFIVLLIREMELSLKYAIGYCFGRRHSRRLTLRKRYRASVRRYVDWLRQLRAGVAGVPSADGAAAPFVVPLRNHADGRSVDLPAPSVAANGNHIALAEPVIINGRRGNKAKGASTEPVATLDTKGGVWLAEPFLLATGSGAPRAASEPMPTVTTGGAGSEDPGCARPMLVEPFMLSRHGDGAPRSMDEPTPTQVAKHSHVLIAPYYGSGSGKTCHSAEQPLPAVPTNDRFGLIIPVTHSDGANRARDVAQDPLPVLTTANRGELAFITAQFGERVGQAPRVHDLGEPTPGICATGHVNLVEGTTEAAEVDILFRMFEAHELAAAMGFNRGAIAYVFAGNKTEQVKQIGNAVEVNQAKANTIAMFLDEVEPRAEFLEAAE